MMGNVVLYVQDVYFEGFHADGMFFCQFFIEFQVEIG